MAAFSHANSVSSVSAPSTHSAGHPRQRQIRRRLAARRSLCGAHRTANLFEVRGRRREPECSDIALDLLSGDDATTLKVEDRIDDGLRLAAVPAFVDQALVIIERPFRIDASLRQAHASA